MKRILTFLAGVLLIAALPVFADSISLSGNGSGSSPVGGSGNFNFSNDGSSNYGPYNSGVPASNTGSAVASLGSLLLPSGATITSATLTWGSTADLGTHSVGASRTESDSMYVSGSYWVCTYYGWFGSCQSGYTQYNYSYGSGGSATVLTTNTLTSAWLDVGGNLFAVSPGSGSVDLLAAGFGGALTSGGAVSFTTQQNSTMSLDVLNYGYHATTYYYPFSDANSFGTNATLNIDYSVPEPLLPRGPSPVPEPSSIVLFLSGMGTLVATVRRQRR